MRARYAPTDLTTVNKLVLVLTIFNERAYWTFESRLVVKPGLNPFLEQTNTKQ